MSDFLNRCSQVLKWLDNDEARADRYWDLFKVWNDTFFRRIHCDWLQPVDVKKRMIELRLTSPLTVPSAEEVPNWFKNELLCHFRMSFTRD